jgi:hypothetical protein
MRRLYLEFSILEVPASSTARIALWRTGSVTPVPMSGRTLDRVLLKSVRSLVPPNALRPSRYPWTVWSMRPPPVLRVSKYRHLASWAESLIYDIRTPSSRREPLQSYLQTRKDQPVYARERLHRSWWKGWVISGRCCYRRRVHGQDVVTPCVTLWRRELNFLLG